MLISSRIVSLAFPPRFRIMFAYDFPSFSYVAVADRLVGRHNLLRNAGADALLGAPNSPSRRIRGSPSAHEAALDGDFLGTRFCGQLDVLLAIHNGRGSSIRYSACADLFHADTDIDFAIRHVAEDGCFASI